MTAHRTCWKLVSSLRLGLLGLLVFLATDSQRAAAEEPSHRRWLYAATPGIRNYLEYGGHGLLVFDIDDGHRFVKRIPTGGLASDGKFAYPSSGDVIDVKTRRIIARLTDEQGRAVGSEKMLEIDWRGGRPIKAGNQFGVGRVVSKIPR